MILIVDANALLWWLADSDQLVREARSAMADPLNDVLVSAATVWEIEIKRALGKVRAPAGLVQTLEVTGFGHLPITLADAELAGRLPSRHRDPFDRMLVAQARRLDAVVVTRDSVFAEYDVEWLAA